MITGPNNLPDQTFLHYTAILQPLWKAREMWIATDNLYIDDYYNNAANPKPIKTGVSYTPATKENGWKFTMSLTYDISDCDAAEDLANVFNTMCNGNDPLPKSREEEQDLEKKLNADKGHV
tara:strand:+ start:542 stop:904 length:363 start_codon:yes stop_codon:yes gene_type:complete